MTVEFMITGECHLADKQLVKELLNKAIREAFSSDYSAKWKTLVVNQEEFTLMAKDLKEEFEESVEEDEAEDVVL